MTWIHAPGRSDAAAAFRDPPAGRDETGRSRPFALEQRFGPGVTASVGLESTRAADPIDPHALSSAAASMHQPADGVVGGKVGYRFK